MARAGRWWLMVVGVAALVGGIGYYLTGQPDAAARLDAQARRYVSLGLSLRAISPDDVDDYFGPADIEPSAALTVAALQGELAALDDALRGDNEGEAATQARRARLLARVAHMRALLGVIEAPKSLGFDAEGLAIFGVAPVAIDSAAQATAREALGALLPGEEPLAERLAAFRARYVMPPETREAVFMRALAKCRALTPERWLAPVTEALDIEWTDTVPAAWHHYEGGYRSRLQVNPAAVADPASAVDIACHEAYPGHHMQFLLMEARRGTVLVEDTLVLLRSPQSALREGAANYGVALAFAPGEREAFSRAVLFPMAGFAPEEAARYEEVHRLAGQLSSAVVPILREYREGRMTRYAAQTALARDALVSSPQALLGFFDRYGALVLGYTVAQDRVRAAIEREEDPWAALADMVAEVDVSVLSDGDGRRQDAPADR